MAKTRLKFLLPHYYVEMRGLGLGTVASREENCRTVVSLYTSQPNPITCARRKNRRSQRRRRPSRLVCADAVFFCCWGLVCRWENNHDVDGTMTFCINLVWGDSFRFIHLGVLSVPLVCSGCGKIDATRRVIDATAHRAGL